MGVDNTLYETRGHLWWDDNAGFEFTSLRYAVNPARFAFIQRRLAEVPADARTVLDIGCGGGYLAEELARAGYRVSALDLSANSIDAARRHAAAGGLEIDYRVGRAQALPFGDASFDVVTCCDMLEHVPDPSRAVAEAARVLRPGGLFFFETVNRTWKSKLVLIKIWQDWDIGGFATPHAHVWEMFIQPAELTAMLTRAGLRLGVLRGLEPSSNPLSLLWLLWRGRRRGIPGPVVAEHFAMRETDRLDTAYLGWAQKKGA